jgi:hypothetical protein
VTTLANYFARDVDDAPIPLIDDVYVPIEPEPLPEYVPPRRRVCRLLALLWDIALASSLGAAYIYVLRYPLEPVDHVWQSVPIGAVAALSLWCITVLVHRCARRGV